MDASVVQPQTDQQPTDCLICFQPVTANLQCGGCRTVFCQACLDKWLTTPGAQPSCPACRREEGLSFRHNVDTQAAADAMPVKCDVLGCDVVYRWCNRAAHLSLCPHNRVKCPFPTCSFVGASPDVDLHAFTCPGARAIKISERVQKVLDEPYSQTAPLSVDAVKNLLGGVSVAAHRKVIAANAATPGAAASCGTGVVEHTVISTDTMQGLAVRYSTSRQELRRLNHITRDTDLMAYPTVLVPAPSPPSPPSGSLTAGANGSPKDAAATATATAVSIGDAPGDSGDDGVSLEVLLALKKRNLVKTLMFLAKCDAGEAVAYLHLNEYHLQNAQRQLHDDREWERTNSKKPKSLAHFAAQCQQRLQGDHCAGCHGAVCDKRRHCTCCGRLYCKVCCVKLGECARSVPKARLGVTNPESKDHPTAVCNDCHATLLLQIPDPKV